MWILILSYYIVGAGNLLNVGAYPTEKACLEMGERMATVFQSANAKPFCIPNIKGE